MRKYQSNYQEQPATVVNANGKCLYRCFADMNSKCSCLKKRYCTVNKSQTDYSLCNFYKSVDEFNEQRAKYANIEREFRERKQREGIGE